MPSLKLSLFGGNPISPKLLLFRKLKNAEFFYAFYIMPHYVIKVDKVFSMLFMVKCLQNSLTNINGNQQYKTYFLKTIKYGDNSEY